MDITNIKNDDITLKIVVNDATDITKIHHYVYYVYDNKTNEKIGELMIYKSDTPNEFLYCGNVGIELYENYRYKGYASKIFELAKEVLVALGFNEVILTCEVGNKASYRSMQKVGARFLCTKDVPKDNFAYADNFKQVNVFKYVLAKKKEVENERLTVVTDHEIDLTVPKGSEGHNNVFDIYLHNTDELIGIIWYDRGSDKEFTKYYGNVGYEIKEKYNGNYYALKALKLLKNVMLNDDIKTMIFNILPENIASRKTVEKLGARILCYRPVPKKHKLYNIEGDLLVIYKFEIGDDENERNKTQHHL